MENRNVGFLVLGIAAVIVVIIFLFNNAMKDIIGSSCGLEHAQVCPMNKTVNEQTYLSLTIAGILAIFGLVLIFTKPKEKIIVKKVTEKIKKKEYDLSHLKKEEREVFSLVKENNAIFQADLIEKTGFGKAKMSRIIDRLEGQGLVERKRRGMTNIVVLKG